MPLTTTDANKADGVIYEVRALVKRTGAGIGWAMISWREFE